MSDSIGDVAFLHSYGDEVLAGAIRKAFEPLEQRGLLRCFIPEYAAEGESTVMYANVCIPLLSDMFLQKKLLVEDAFSCYGSGQIILPILLEACDFKSIPQMGPQEMWVTDMLHPEKVLLLDGVLTPCRKEIREMKYLPSDGTPLADHADEDAAIKAIVDDFCKIMWGSNLVFQPGEYPVGFVCVKHVEWNGTHTIMQCYVEDRAEMVTVVRKDNEKRATDLIALVNGMKGGWCNVLLEDNGHLDDCGGIADPCPCSKIPGAIHSVGCTGICNK